MKEDPIEIARAFASVLSVPVFLVDPDGDLLYYNPPAEQVLGRVYDETGPMPAAMWGRIFVPVDEDGTPLVPDELPLMVALSDGIAATDTMWIRGIDNERRHINVAAFPILRNDGKILGAMAVFWEL